MKKIIKTFLALTLCIASLCITSNITKADIQRLKRLDRSNWKIAVFHTDAPETIEEHGDSSNAFNSPSSRPNEGPAENMIDGNYGTHWHDDYSSLSTSNFSIIIQLPKAEKIAGFEALRRNGGGNGELKTYTVYTLNDENLQFSNENKEWKNQLWGEAVTTGNFSAGTVAAKFDVTPIATHIRIDVSGGESSKWGTLSELNLYTTDERTPLSFDNMTFDHTPTSESNGANLKTIFSDGNPYTFWTSKDVTNGIDGNVHMTIDLGDYYDLTGIDYTKRYHNDGGNKWNCTGNLNDYKVEVSIDGKTWNVVKTGNTNKVFDYKVNNVYKSFLFEGNSGTTIEGTTNIEFNPTYAKYVRITATKSFHWDNESNKHFTIADLNLYGTKSKGINVASSSFNSNIAANTALRYTDGSLMDGTSGNRTPLTMFNDNRQSGNYFDFGSNYKSGYMEIDLGSHYQLNSINALFYFGNGNERRYKNVIVMVSENRSFTAEDIVYNNDTENKHGFGYGDITDSSNETSEGRTIEFEPKNARFIRIYMAGNTTSGGGGNQVVEIEVYGNPSEKPNASKYQQEADLSNKEWLFESFYSDETGVNAVAPSEETKVAKFITADVLRVKAQSEVKNGTANVRFITSVASGNLEKIKFKIEVIDENGNTKTGFIKTKRAYEKIVADGVEISSASNVFDNDASTYFVVCKLNDIPSSKASNIVKVTPYWLPNGYNDTEENYVTGVTRAFTVQEFFNNASVMNEGE